MPTRTGKADQSKDDESPELQAVPTKCVSDQVQKMSEDAPDTAEDSSEKSKMSDVIDDSTKKTQEMSGEESDTMDVSTEKEKTMSDVEGDATKKAKEMSEESDSMDVATEKEKIISDVEGDSSKKAKEMSEKESDSMDVSTEKAKTMSEVEGDSSKKAKKMSEEESYTMDVSTDEAKKMSDVVDDSTEKVKKVSDEGESTEKSQVPDANENSSEKAQKTPDAGDESPEEVQKMSGEESEAADESTEEVLLDTSTSLDFKVLLVPVGKNKAGELYFWQPSYPAYLPPPEPLPSASLKWHQKEESGNTKLLDASLAMSDDYRFLHAVVDESSEESPRVVWRKPTSQLVDSSGSSKGIVVWRKPTSQLVDSSGSSKGTVVWQARTALTYSADLAFQASDLEPKRRVLLVPFNPDVAMGKLAPGSDEGSLSGNQSLQCAEASSEAETSDDICRK